MSSARGGEGYRLDDRKYLEKTVSRFRVSVYRNRGQCWDLAAQTEHELLKTGTWGPCPQIWRRGRLDTALEFQAEASAELGLNLKTAFRF